MTTELSEIANTLKSIIPEEDVKEVSWMLYCRYKNPLDPNCRERLITMPKIRKQVVEFIAEELRKEGAADLAEELEELSRETVTARKRPTKQQWRRIFRPTKAISRKRPICATKPEKGVTRSKRLAWMANIKYLILSGPRRGKTWTTKRVVSYNMRKRPILKDKKRNRRLPKCRKPRTMPDKK